MTVEPRRDAGAPHRLRVVGCGIIGLTTAIRLQAEGFEVDIVARDLPPLTTSNKAAAIWQPYQVEPRHRVDRWAAFTYDVYARQYGHSGVGISEIEWLAVSKEAAIERPYWLHAHHPSRDLGPEELPKGYRSGFGVKGPFIHSTVYLQHLVDRFRTAGGVIEQRTLSSLDDLGTDAAALINCAGLGARELVDDAAVYGIRGQLAVVRRPAEVRVLGDDDTYAPDPVYIFPRDEVCLLGGTAEVGCEDVEEDEAMRHTILQRCRALEPSLEHSEFLYSIVGIRPGRKHIRLELEEPADGRGIPIVHNYGHGGAGFTVAWGCAEEVTTIVLGCLP